MGDTKADSALPTALRHIYPAIDDDDAFYLFLQKQNRSRAPYTLRKVRTIRLFRGPSTNDLKK